jgi:L-ascorbate metabolism protein UlaG (beta-lactamase superfamily)
MRIQATWYGTAALHLVVDGSLGVFFDPFFQWRGKARPRINADPDTVDLEPLNAVFVSHSHFDHMFNLPNLIRRYPSAQAYAPEMTVDNCRNLCTGAAFEDYVYELSESDWRRIHTVTAGDEIGLSSQDETVSLQATAIKSCHVRYDVSYMIRVLLKRDMWRRWRHYLRFGTAFPLKEVIGWELRLQTAADSRRIVYFGSLCRKYPEVLSRHAGCDYLIIPLAGRMELLSYASVITEALHPKAVVPVHCDDSFPPLSRLIDYSDYVDWLAATLPEAKLIELVPERPTEI